MGLGDMFGKVTSALGDDFDIQSKLGELGIDPSMLEGLDIEAVKSFVAEKGLDLSMLEGMGINVEELLEKFKSGS